MYANCGMLTKGMTQQRRLRSIARQPSLSDGRIVIPYVLCVDDMVGKLTERREIQPDRTQVTLSVMIRAKYKHVAWQIGTLMRMTKGPDVVCFRVCLALPQGNSKTADLTLVMMT